MRRMGNLGGIKGAWSPAVVEGFFMHRGSGLHFSQPVWHTGWQTVCRRSHLRLTDEIGLGGAFIAVFAFE